MAGNASMNSRRSSVWNSRSVSPATLFSCGPVADLLMITWDGFAVGRVAGLEAVAVAGNMVAPEPLIPKAVRNASMTCFGEQLALTIEMIGPHLAKAVAAATTAETSHRSALADGDHHLAKHRGLSLVSRR